jgi:hypothetical protein
MGYTPMEINMRAIATLGVAGLIALSTALPSDPPAVKPPALKAGDKAPEIGGVNAGGDALMENDLAGKTVLVAFWKLDAKGGGMPIEPLREIRRIAGDILILTVCVNGTADWDAWSKLLLDQGTVNYGDGERRFIDDPKWWNVTEVSYVKRKAAAAYGVTTFPEYFILKPNGTLGGVSVPANELKVTVEKLLK